MAPTPLLRIFPLLAAALLLMSPTFAAPGASPEGAKGPLVPNDLAVGKPATASSAQGENKAANAFDADAQTRWCAADGSVPQWLRVDLGKPEEIAGCRITWEKDNTSYAHRLESSADGTKWTLLADRTRAPAKKQVEEILLGAKDVRYVRLTVTGAGPGAWACVSEFEVFGTQRVAATAKQAAKEAAMAAVNKTDKSKLFNGLKGPAGFDMTVFAAPPDVNYPTCVAAAPTGELFVGIDEDGSLGKAPDKGRVVKCIDTDGDGKADRFITFAKMDHPRGLVWDDGKLYVLHPPFLSVYYDDRGTGVADRSEILVTGISTEAHVKARGADHTTNGIRLGIDGWIYVAMGDFGALKAVQKDGKEVQLRGGGVVRVRPDGTGLEAYSTGQRNIYDVAIDPLMNVFTRDNTNDGDNWNDRLSFIVPTGNYGYPRLFMHFPGEFVDALADYGGGSPCGSLFVDEPGLPGGTGHGFYTVEWGRSVIDRHPLTPAGAGFKAAQEKFMDLPRGTDMDVDGQSRFYCSSWANGGFSFSGPNVGFVVRLAPQGYKPAPFPDVKKAAEADLVRHLASPSGVCRMAAQREILRRGDNPALASALEQLAGSNQPIAGRVAALLTLKLLRGSKADDALATFTKNDDLREYALRALADRPDDASAPAGPFVQALKDPSPRVRLQAAWGLGRLNKADAAPALLPLAADPDFLVSHTAVNTLVTLKASDVCLKAVDPTRVGTSAGEVIPGALKALQRMHDLSVVDGLTERLGKIQDPTVRGQILGALCRLYYDEAEWDGSWWSTRPDTRGPYYKPVEWAGSGKLKPALQAALREEKPEVVRTLVLELKRNRIDFPEMMEFITKAAATDPAFKEVLLDVLGGKDKLAPEQIAAIKSLATSDKSSAALRVKAIRLLTRGAAPAPASLDASVDALAAVAASDKPDPELAALVNEFINDAKFAKSVPYFTKLAASDAAPKRELGYSVLLSLAGSKLTKPDVKAAATKAIEEGWGKPTTAASLLRAVGRTKAGGYKDWIEAMQTDPNADVVRAAAYASERLGLKNSGPAAETRDAIETLGYEKTVELVKHEKGDAALGMELFTKQGCIACHTTSPDQPPKGPLLAGIAARYSRTELCESILKPSAKISQGFETQWFKVGRDILEGFVTREGGDDLEMRNVAGVTQVIQKSEIKGRGKRDTSVMPEGLVIKLTPRDLASIIAYLESLKTK